MGGMGKLFTRIIPIIMLVCFVCLGITHTFNQIGTENHTYLTSETINVGTQENPTYLTYYNLDVNSYINNVNSNILKKATDKAVDVETFDATLNSFNNIWKDGYQVGDIYMTIINAIILTINTILTIINVVLIPIRIIAGLLLTGISLIGININTSGVIINTLKAFLNILAIPLIQPVGEQGQTYPSPYYNETWTFNEFITNDTFNYESQYLVIRFACNGTQYLGFFITYDNNNLTMYYETNDAQNPRILVYQYNKWINDNYKVITFNVENQPLYQDEINAINTLLSYNAEQKGTPQVVNRQIESTPVENETKSYIKYAI